MRKLPENLINVLTSTQSKKKAQLSFKHKLSSMMQHRDSDSSNGERVVKEIRGSPFSSFREKLKTSTS